MPPRTRQSTTGGIGRPATRRQRAPVARNTSDSRWNFTSTNDDVRESVEEADTNGFDADHHEDMPSSPEVEEAVAPLREMADRVGKEVESFAIQFDMFLNDLPTRQNKYDAAKEVVQRFEDIAKDAVDALKRGHQKERMEQLRREWSERARLSASGSIRAVGQGSRSGGGGVVQGMKADAVKEMRLWQQEADIWRLFYIVIDYFYDSDVRNERMAKELAILPPPHRYTSEKEIWERFLLENPVAKAHTIYKQWFEQTADHQESDLDGIMQTLEERLGTGRGLWKKGWMHTREKIKGEKRQGRWASSSNDRLPEIRSTSGTGLLVTNVDPDAATRQGRALEKEDKHFEQAMWIACWEMLRRGKSWQDVLSWCEEHAEGWRAAVLCPATDATDALSNAAWRKMCYLTSQSGCSNDYEAAVYGLLGGNVNAVQKVCHTTDDRLFAHYSCTLVRQFELYVRHNFPGRVASLAQRPVAEDVLDDENVAQRIITDFVQQLRRSQETAADAAQPLKVIEGFLLANDTESMAAYVGQALSELDKLHGGHEQAIIHHDDQLRPEEDTKAASSIAADQRALRIVAHMYLVLTAIDDDSQPPETILTEQNVVIAHIQALRYARKRDFAAVYASRIEDGNAVVALARVLQDINGVREQQTMLGLMVQFDMDQSLVLGELLRWTMITKLNAQKTPKNLLRIIEDCEVTKLYPGQQIISGFLAMDTSLSNDDKAVLDTLQWFQVVPGLWKATFEALAEALRTCLMTGQLPCAVKIVERFPYEDISKQKSYGEIGRSVNIMDKSLMPEDQDEALRWQILQQQSQTYYELEQLVHAIETLASWVGEERPYSAQGKPNSQKQQELKKAKATMDESMMPILSGILLQPVDDDEKKYLDRIRDAYLPEIIMAYITALYTSGPLISRDAYIQIMDLSVIIASKDSNDLAAIFTQAGRMRELVQLFAQSSKMMLVMKATGRPQKPRKDGKGLGLWEIGPQGQGVVAEIDDS
ncbi:Nucleoporin nup84 [Recurvomyces mirabilis]|uniref:Nuclear pore complex protein n=1 Tax=Recurvomyces mirabilis TaxID=574656 RepID=A0AAE0TSK5_9PEZI|nr:Nucleoporin nup84 [Recurvomyces mirabilis]KAK5160077.1 Nucleoporin nup84 [Recurvomyces mirabilis]